ncbi:unnamed protein product [Ixodes persulcatus]
MPQRCSAVGCSNNSKRCRGLSFYRFSSASLHPTKRRLWIRAIRRNNQDGSPWQPSKRSRVCSCHFEKGSCFVPFFYWCKFKLADRLIKRLCCRVNTMRMSQRGGSSYFFSPRQPRGAAEQQEIDTKAEDLDCTLQANTTANHDTAAVGDSGAATPLEGSCQHRLLQSKLQSRIVGLERQFQADKLKTQAQDSRIKELEEGMVVLKVSKLSLINVMKTSDFLIYTGLLNHFLFKNLYDMIFTRNPNLCSGNYKRVLTGEEELFMVLVRLRTEMSVKEVSRIFGIFMSTVSRFFFFLDCHSET